MQIHDLQPSSGSTHRPKKVGRGIGSGHGKNSGRGAKGHKKRGSPNPHFEGGQTPLHRRIPQLRGFKAVNKKDYAVLNVGKLEELGEVRRVTPGLMNQIVVIRDSREGW